MVQAAFLMMNWRNRLLTIGVLLVAFAARLYTLGDVPFWYDEGLVGWTARRWIVDTALWTAADVHPPLYFWAVTVWRLFAGETEFALRLLSVAFGLLSVVAVYKIGERIHDPALGNLAALFLGLSRFHIWWSQELRMYILGSMFMLFSVWLTLRIAHGRPRRADWVAYVLVSLGGLLSIYLVAFALAFESLYMTILLALGWLNQRSGGARFAAAQGLVTWRKYLGWVAAQATVVLLFLPWFILFARSYRTWSDSTPFEFTLFVQFYSTMLAAGAAANIDEWLWPVLGVWAILLAGALIGLRGKHDGAGRRGGWLIVFLLVLPPLTVYLGTSPRSFFYTPRVEARYLFPFIWTFSLVLAWSVWRIARAQKWLGVVAAIVVIGVFLAANSQYYAGRIPNDVYQSLTATLRAQMLPGDGVVLHDDRTWPIFEFYFQQPDRIWRGVPNGARMREGDAERLLGDFWQAHDALWMVWNEDALRIDEGHQLELWLASRAVLTHETGFGTKRLILYVRTPERAQAFGRLSPGAAPTYRTPMTVGGGLTLVGYDQALRRYRVGDDVLVGLYWQNTTPATLAAVLKDAAGREVARQTLAVPAGASRSVARFAVTTALAPGSYQVVVVMGDTAQSVAQAEIASSSGASATTGLPSFTPHEVRFQNGIRLLGYDMLGTLLHPGDNVQLTLYWQTDQPVAQRYKVFVHLLGTQWNPRSNNPLWGQRDQEPANGALPTTAWGVGSVIEDAYLFRIAPDAPPGKYQIEIGMYHPTTGERLMVQAADGTADHAILFDVQVQ
ncbi:MAG: glycosyltransferase family 39 protein [Chloroflexi bacterium]|nr:glycosyltransferase family 39 protein [Chloroflexota bacterium]